MKKIYTLLCINVLALSIAIAQNNNLIIYSQDGIRFTVILNGVRQNMQPETNVKITQLNAPNYQVKLIFSNNMPDLNQTIYLMYGGDITQNTEYTYALSNVKGKYKLKFKSAAPINGNAIQNIPNQTVVIYNQQGNTVIPSNGTTTTTTTSSTSTTTTTGSPGNVGVNVNSGNVNISVGGTNSSSTTTSTTTSVSTTTSTNSTTNYVLPGYNGVYGCAQPMSSANFEAAKNTIKSKNFDESRLTIAKQIIGTNCLLCSQIKELMLLLTFEQSRLDLAKFAWHHVLDKGNYFQLNDAFTFESSISDLNKYIQTH